MISIERRLSVLLLVGLSLFSVFCAVGLGLHIRRALLRQFDEALIQTAQTLADLVQLEHDGDLEIEFHEAALPAFQPSNDPQYYQLCTAKGEHLARSASLGNRDLPQIANVPLGTAVVEDMLLPDGRRGRLVAMGFVPRWDDDSPSVRQVDPSVQKQVVLSIARSREPLDHALSVVLGAAMVMALLLPCGAFLIIRWGVRRGLVPLHDMANEVAAVQPTDLGYRFDAGRLPSELRPIALRLNELLARLDAAFARQRRFTSNVAHELRTPLAELRTLAEVGSRWTPELRAENDLCAYFEDVRTIVLRMEAVVAALLRLARAQNRAQAVVREPLHLAALVRTVGDRFASVAMRQNVRYRMHLADVDPVETDAALLEILLANLFDNAVTYTPHGGEIEAGLEQQPDAVVFSLKNTNNQLAADDIVHVTEPFWRKDASRTDATRAGLGLSLVTALAVELGIDVRICLSRADLFRVTLRIPRCVPSEEAGQ